MAKDQKIISIWKFVKHTDKTPDFISFTNEADPRSKVQLKLNRRRDKTFKQFVDIEIQIINNSNDYQYSGSITSDLLSLDKDLYQLKLYGTGLDKPDFLDIHRLIDDNFLEIKLANDGMQPKDPTIEPEDVRKQSIQKVFEMYCEYIYNCDIKPQSGLYNIPTVEFKDMLSDSDYYFLNFKEIKNSFRDKEYIKYSTGRTDNIVRIANKPTRVISLHQKKVDETIKRMIDNGTIEEKKEVTKVTNKTKVAEGQNE